MLLEAASQWAVFCFKANELFKNRLWQFEEEASRVLDSQQLAAVVVAVVVVVVVVGCRAVCS